MLCPCSVGLAGVVGTWPQSTLRVVGGCALGFRQSGCPWHTTTAPSGLSTSGYQVRCRANVGDELVGCEGSTMDIAAVGDVPALPFLGLSIWEDGPLQRPKCRVACVTGPAHTTYIFTTILLAVTPTLSTCIPTILLHISPLPWEKKGSHTI